MKDSEMLKVVFSRIDVQDENDMSDEQAQELFNSFREELKTALWKTGRQLIEKKVNEFKR